ncbi:MAG: DUF86 domain-containing protein [Longimicrobiales bacterium]
MLDSIDRLASHLEGRSAEDFGSEALVQDAVVRQLGILGEAAGRISRETCARFTEIPWPKVTGMRHRLIHDYFEVDLVLVWRVATSEVPALRSALAEMLDELASDGS